jgi:hypothetical protein
MTIPTLLPDTDRRWSRVIAQQRAANIAAEGQPVDLYRRADRDAEIKAAYDNYVTARAVLENPGWYDGALFWAAKRFVREYENATPVRRCPAMDYGPVPRPLCAEDQRQLQARRAFVEGYDPDHIRPRDMGLALVGGVIFLAVVFPAVWFWLSLGGGV